MPLKVGTRTYANRQKRAIYALQCQHCGADFVGPLGKRSCSRRCMRILQHQATLAKEASPELKRQAEQAYSEFRQRCRALSCSVSDHEKKQWIAEYLDELRRPAEPVQAEPRVFDRWASPLTWNVSGYDA